MNHGVLIRVSRLIVQHKLAVAAVALLLVTIVGIVISVLPPVVAAIILTPERHLPALPPPPGCVHRTFTGSAGVLAGWYCRTSSARDQGTIIYLHGIADNRDSAAAVVERFLPLGFDVIAYDSRGHGSSSGDFCTYGYHEKDDVRRVVAEAGINRLFLVGHSLGAAIALQAAALEPAVQGVAAVATFADLRTMAIERDDVRALPPWFIAWGIAQVERAGAFVMDDISPVRAAARIDVPVLLVHGADDRRPPPVHSERVLAALRGPKQLIVVPGAGHHDVLGVQVWKQIEDWLVGVAER